MLRQRTGICDVVIQMSKGIRRLTWIMLSLTVVGCDTQSFRVGQRTTVQYGMVRNVEQVRLQSAAPVGALIGGTLGLVTSGGGRAAPRNAILGAVVGGAATAAVQGNRTGIAYTVEMLNGSTTRIVSDQSEIRVGDCVAIEGVGDTNNIRREPSAYCASEYQPAVEAVREDARAAAVHCEAAKEEMVRAGTPQELDTATRKINLLCN